MDFLPQRGRIRFVLVSPSHPGNIGSAARAIKTMGFNRLYVVSPRHPEYRTDLDAIAFSTHAVDVLQNSVCTETLLEALKMFLLPVRSPATIVSSDLLWQTCRLPAKWSRPV